ncbi:unnamed protein product [Brachionus calyciflorus]|uniref:Uncharacterized protein n=1 Tax=Brachionus calyciflorus TaxID=104777 RepID=A0A813U4P6_9BILA|nr:unnamed protein product [Brachionus calyciflorus]
MRNYLVNIIKLSNILVHQKPPIRSVSSIQIPQLVKLQQTKSLKVLENVQIVQFRSNIEQILMENEKYQKIFDEILEKASNLKRLKYLDKEKLSRKLKFRLPYVIFLLRKLTNTCNKAFLNDSTKLKLLTETISNKLEDNLSDDDDELDIEIELLGFDNFDFEDYDVSSIGDKIFGSDEQYHKFLMNDYMTLTKLERDEILDDLLVDFGPDLRKKYESRMHFDYLVLTKGKLTKNVHLDYEENVIESIERELKVKIDDLRLDFKFIDEYINELRIIIAKEWLFNYEDKCLQSIYGSSSDNTIEESVVYVDDKQNDKKNDDPLN